MKKRTFIHLASLVVAAGLIAAANTEAAEKPVKVFILAGQSNMEGHCAIRTFDYLGDDPQTAPILKQIRGADGKPKVCDHVWISYLTGKPDGKSNGVGSGKLTAGYGARTNPTQLSEKIGPEFTFGLRMDEKLGQKVLLIKTAWGGQSLSFNFRPPSAGPVEGGDPEEVGQKYRMMIEHVKSVLKDIKSVIPDYDPKQGYEIGGFVWVQGWNDATDSKTYPKKGPNEGNRFAKYSEWLADLIRDMRKDLNAPEMPVAIGVLGVDGVKTKSTEFREAMAAPAAMPEFKGRVVAVQMAPFWDEKLEEVCQKYAKNTVQLKDVDKQMKDGAITREEWQKKRKEIETAALTPEEHAIMDRGRSALGFHYNGSPKFFTRVGFALADALLPFQK